MFNVCVYIWPADGVVERSENKLQGRCCSVLRGLSATVEVDGVGGAASRKVIVYKYKKGDKDIDMKHAGIISTI